MADVEDGGAQTADSIQGNTASNGDNRVALLQLHLNEYQALTTRATYFITLLGSIFPVMAVYLAIVAGLCKPATGTLEDAYNVLLTWPIRRALVFWGNLSVLQLMLLVWGALSMEQHNIVRYIETELRPLVESLTHCASFWGYEDFLRRSRRSALVLFGEVVPVPAAPVVMYIVTKLLLRHSFSVWDVTGLLVNAIMWGFFLLMVIGAVRTRHAWERHLAARKIKKTLAGPVGAPTPHP